MINQNDCVAIVLDHGKSAAYALGLKLGSLIFDSPFAICTLMAIRLQ
jgi:hypothetical protein